MVLACGERIHLTRIVSAQGLVWTVMVVDLDEVVKAALPLREVESARLGGFLLEGQVHARLLAVLLWLAANSLHSSNQRLSTQ